MNTVHISRILFGTGLACVALMTGGCAAPIETISSHTIAADANTSRDVVWIRDGHNRLHRCTAEGAAPVCKMAGFGQ